MGVCHSSMSCMKSMDGAGGLVMLMCAMCGLGFKYFVPLKVLLLLS